MDLVTKSVCQSRRSISSEEQWSTDPTTLLPGVHVSRTLIPNQRFCDVPVRVVNVLSEPITPTAETTIADLQSVEVVKSGSVELKTEVMTHGSRQGNQKVQSKNKSAKTPELIEKLLNDVHPSLPEITVCSLESLLLEYQDVFSKSETHLGSTELVTHNIDTG